MKNNPFTHEEISLMSIYNADGTREGLIAALTEMWGVNSVNGCSERRAFGRA